MNEVNLLRTGVKEYVVRKREREREWNGYVYKCIACLIKYVYKKTDTVID